MRRSAAVALLLAACHPQTNQLSFEGADYKTQAEKVAHGERLTQVLGCRGCHGEDFQGRNMEDNPKYAAMYAPNLTLLLPSYSDADLDKLIRHGVTKDGRRFWFMQVETYQFLSDADFAALVAYLRTLKPGGKVLPPFSFNAREQKDVDEGVMGDAKVQIAKYRDHPPVDLGPEHAWGRHLVQTTCTGCHNNALQGWKNFTPNLDIAGAYSKAELTRLLTTGQGKTGKDVGEMSGIARTYFSHLTPREREAIVDYILARANQSPAH
jgi:mono/diheme cytochrome c family protein